MITREMTLEELLRRLDAGEIPVSAAARVILTEPEAGDPADRDVSLALFDAWDREDARATPEEREAERLLFARFEENVDETRRALGMRLL